MRDVLTSQTWASAGAQTKGRSGSSSSIGRPDKLPRGRGTAGPPPPGPFPRRLSSCSCLCGNRLPACESDLKASACRMPATPAQPLPAAGGLGQGFLASEGYLCPRRHGNASLSGWGKARRLPGSYIRLCVRAPARAPANGKERTAAAAFLCVGVPASLGVRLSERPPLAPGARSRCKRTRR